MATAFAYIVSQIGCPKCPCVLTITDNNTLRCNRCGDEYYRPSVELEVIKGWTDEAEHKYQQGSSDDDGA